MRGPRAASRMNLRDDGLELQVVLERAVVPARQEQQPLRLVGRLVQLLAHRVRHLLVAARVHERAAPSPGRAAPPPRRVERLEPGLASPRRRSGTPAPGPSAGPAQQASPRAPGRWPPRRRSTGRARPAWMRLEAAHARPAQRHRAERAPAAARPWPARRRWRRARSSPSDSPWPRASKASAAIPSSRQPRAKSKWLSFAEPPPWRITTPTSGSPSGQEQRVREAVVVPSSGGVGVGWRIAPS